MREGLSALGAGPRLLAPVVLLTLLAVFALNFGVTLPLLATSTLHSGLGLISILLTVSSIEAVTASLFIAGARRATSCSGPDSATTRPEPGGSISEPVRPNSQVT